MANEAINTIRQAEADSAAVIADAAVRARDAEKAAAEKARQIALRARADADEVIRRSAEEAGKKADAVIAEGVAKARADAKKAVALYDANMNAAVNEIIRGIFEKWQ